ncbi:MAG: GyrI-like domain-containing protein [Brachybacterium tyrofermentans]|uniref:GyrI-like domain-containing protein n=1 Tax=Brachybacterium tyrofermentans TaxID=47848 RepID=A0ABW0FLT3_9MICO|nr:GyrI-like domain-containing protein [Brachybacterium tyrofermentans]
MTPQVARKLDVKKDLETYRARRGTFRTLEVPSMHFLMIDGQGDPNTSPAYEAALGELYPLAYALKFRSRRTLGRDYVVPPLEGLWWADDMEAFTALRDKSRWHWRLMLMTPPWITAEQVETAGAVRWEQFAEGLCVQTLHVGPYDAEGPVLEQMHHEVIPARDLEMTGRHHEIYLGDPRRAAPERLRTILRQPVRRMLR